MRLEAFCLLSEGQVSRCRWSLNFCHLSQWLFTPLPHARLFICTAFCHFIAWSNSCWAITADTHTCILSLEHNLPNPSPTAPEFLTTHVGLWPRGTLPGELWTAASPRLGPAGMGTTWANTQRTLWLQQQPRPRKLERVVRKSLGEKDGSEPCVSERYFRSHRNKRFSLGSAVRSSTFWVHKHNSYLILARSLLHPSKIPLYTLETKENLKNTIL